MGSYCEAMGSELCQPYLKEGENCEALGAHCDPWLLRCMAQSNGEGESVCTPFNEDGDACSRPTDCKSGYCERDDYTCEMLSPDHASCSAPECDTCGVCSPSTTSKDQCI